MNGSESCFTRADGQLAFIRPCGGDGGGDPTSRFGVYLTYQKLNNEGATTEEETIDRARYDRRDKVQRRLDRYFTVVSMLRSEKLELHFRLSPRIEAFFNSPHRRSKPPQKLVH